MKTTKKVPLIFIVVNQDKNLKLIKIHPKVWKKALNIRNIRMQLFEYSNNIRALEMAEYEYE